MKFGEEELTFLSIFDGGEKSRQNTIQNIQTQIDGLSDEAKSAGIEYELLHLMRKLKAITKKRRKAPAFRYGDIRRIQISE